MDSKRNWTFENFHVKLDELDDRIRTKALEIADGLMVSGKFTEEEAIHEGIIRAEEWFYDLEG